MVCRRLPCWLGQHGIYVFWGLRTNHGIRSAHLRRVHFHVCVQRYTRKNKAKKAVKRANISPVSCRGQFSRDKVGLLGCTSELCDWRLGRTTFRCDLESPNPTNIDGKSITVKPERCCLSIATTAACNCDLGGRKLCRMPQFKVAEDSLVKRDPPKKNYSLRAVPPIIVPPRLLQARKLECIT